MTDIVKTTENQFIESGFDVVYQKQYEVPDSVRSSITCYEIDDDRAKQDSGIMLYNVEKSNRNQTLDLKFCITKNKYCTKENCTACSEKNMASFFSFTFSRNYLQQFRNGSDKTNTRKEQVLSFEYASSFSKVFAVCPRQHSSLSALLNPRYSGATENIFINSKIHEVLLYSMNCLADEQDKEIFTCRFLADENGVEKIYAAKDVLLQNLGTPVTIKELSRIVATNECYLKKGFKEIFGTTIFDFYQQQRMDHAKYLLYQKGQSVTDVADMLGYSSISHFSTAFKKQTGIKPCELLLKSIES